MKKIFDLAILSEANLAFREKKYQEAYDKYSLAIINNPDLKKIIENNLKIIEKKIVSLKNEKNLKFENQNKELKNNKLSLEQSNIVKNIEKYNLDLKDYYYLNNITNEGDHPLIHYVKNWNKMRLIIPDYFDCWIYRSIYNDIQKSLMNPLLHFVEFGKKEGRIGYIGKRDLNLVDGHLAYNKNKETVVFVSHESSATGAPLLGYNIVEELNTFYNIIHVVIKKSKIKDIIKNNCFKYIDDISDNVEAKSFYILKNLQDKYKIRALILNSVETYPVLVAAAKFKIATVSLIHEFSEYTRPIGKMTNTLSYATEVIVPAKIIKNSILKELNEVTGINNDLNHISIIPQGKLPFLPNTYGDDDNYNDLCKKLNIKNINNYKIVVGSGYVQVRKGVDLFIATARYIKQKYPGKCKFIWVGDGYDPVNDFTCSLWLQREIKIFGLQDDFIFLKHQKSLDVVFSMADIFCLTSRMDPFPNVAIDAMEFNLPIACFEDASGIHDFLFQNNADYLSSEYLDTHGLANEIVNYFIKNNKKKTVNSKIVKSKLLFSDYVKAINLIIQKAILKNIENKNSALFITNNKLLDLDYYGSNQDLESSAYSYANLYKNAMHKMSPNPRPGFSQMKWIADYTLNTKETPVESAFHLGKSNTHNFKIIPLSNKEIVKIKFRYAIHLHLYYIDLAKHFYDYFINLIGEYHLFITIVNEKDYKYIFDYFKSCGAAYVEVVVVENVGRDIGPMIFNLKSQLLSKDYEIIGHFHSKKSVSTDSNLGNNWREYLLQNLIGSREVVKSILSLFENNKVGLIFAEDNHIVDVGDNINYINNLCKTLNISEVTGIHMFPLGNMFWARVDAIRQLFELDPSSLLQPEPLPYDGTYLHAIERITPHLVESNGYEYLTVHKLGTRW